MVSKSQDVSDDNIVILKLIKTSKTLSIYVDCTFRCSYHTISFNIT